MKKFLTILAILILLALASFLSGNYKRGSTDNPLVGGLQSCPDEKIVNQMPQVGERTTPNSYYIVDGVRKEISEYDAAWVEANCNVPTQTVY